MNLSPDAQDNGSACSLPTTDMGFGERLRLERERRRITLASIAANTKIGLPLLQGLERGNVSRWPSGIFRRSFIRAYAEAIGLEPDDIAREFLERFPDPLESTWGISADAAPAEARRKTSADDMVLRLKLADSGATVKRGRVLAGMRTRWAAVAWDAGVLMAIGAVLFMAFNQFWMPLGIAMLAYYGASILLLGNTPGVSLFAPTPRHGVRGKTGRLASPASLLKTVGSAIRQASGRRDEVANR
jgi:transcriptional regulator with XRE-family HTH domain